MTIPYNLPPVEPVPEQVQGPVIPLGGLFPGFGSTQPASVEITAMGMVAAALDPLDPGARRRVVAWVSDRLDIP